MTIEIREFRDEDFFAWLPLFDAYCRFAGTTLDDQKALRVWNRLREPADPLTGAGAFDEGGALLGFVHSRTVSRALSASTGVTVDDLLVAEERRREGIGTALLEYARSRPGVTRFRWAVDADNEAALALAEKLGRRTGLVVFESEEPAAVPDAEAEPAEATPVETPAPEEA